MFSSVFFSQLFSLKGKYEHLRCYCVIKNSPLRLNKELISKSNVLAVLYYFYCSICNMKNMPVILPGYLLGL